MRVSECRYEDQLAFFDAEIDKLQQKRKEFEAKLQAAKQIAAMSNDQPRSGDSVGPVAGVPVAWTALQSLTRG